MNPTHPFRSDFDPDAPSTAEGIFGLPSSPKAFESAGVILIPVPWDATTSYGAGTSAGPAAIWQASQQVDLFDRETGRPYESGIAMLGASLDDSENPVATWNEEACIEVAKMLAETDGQGDPEHPGAMRVDALSAQVNDWVRTEALFYRKRGALVGIVGGEHSVALGGIQAAADTEGEIGVLQIDAHADLRPAYTGLKHSHASVFDNVLRDVPEVQQLTQVGVRDLGSRESTRIQEDNRIQTFFDADLAHRSFAGESWKSIGAEIVATLPQKVYVSFDVDGLDPAHCPNTGTPVPGGLSFQQAVALIRWIAESGRQIVGFDLCEVAPDPTGINEWDANVGARLIYKLIGFALRSGREG